MNYIGMVIGCLTVIEDSGKKTKDRKRIYVCECKCGTRLLRPSAQLLRCIRKKWNPHCGCVEKVIHENANNFLGKKLGMLKVLYPLSKRDAGRRVQWMCECDCGRFIVKDSNYFRASPNPNCGCWNKEIHDRAGLKHGMSLTTEHHTWRHIIDRCHNPNCPQYQDYGGRGIMVCERWRKSFAAFYEDMRDKPSQNMTIDRIDNDGDYEPGNCRWSTRKQQARNTRSNVLLTIDGRTACLVEWQEVLGMTREQILKKHSGQMVRRDGSPYSRMAQ